MQHNFVTPLWNDACHLCTYHRVRW